MSQSSSRGVLSRIGWRKKQSPPEDEPAAAPSTDPTPDEPQAEPKAEIPSADIEVISPTSPAVFADAKEDPLAQSPAHPSTADAEHLSPTQPGARQESRDGATQSDTSTRVEESQGVDTISSAVEDVAKPDPREDFAQLLATEAAVTSTIRKPSPSPTPYRSQSPASRVGEKQEPDGPDPRVPTQREGPPTLNYTLRTRKLSIFIFWTLIIIDLIVIPLVLYFCLHYLAGDKHGGTLSDNAVFSISTGALGGVSIIEYLLRFRRLWKKGSKCRVLGARRKYLDWFHWNFSFGWVVVIAELVIGTSFPNPPIRLLAMPAPSMCWVFGIQLIVEDLMRYYHIPTPVRISSVPQGAPMRPGIYSIIEDVVAVDGSGGTEFRERLDIRYRASHDFRQMLHRLTAFWGVGAIGVAILCTVLIFTIGREAAYVVGWTVPFIWAGLWTPPTFWYVKRCLKYEWDNWGRDNDEEGVNSTG